MFASAFVLSAPMWDRYIPSHAAESDTLLREVRGYAKVTQLQRGRVGTVTQSTCLLSALCHCFLEGGPQLQRDSPTWPCSVTENPSPLLVDTEFMTSSLWMRNIQMSSLFFLTQNTGPAQPRLRGLLIYLSTRAKGNFFKLS